MQSGGKIELITRFIPECEEIIELIRDLKVGIMQASPSYLKKKLGLLMATLENYKTDHIILREIAGLYFDLDDYQNAILYLERVLGYLKELKPAKPDSVVDWIISVYNSLGNAYIKQGNYPLAIQNYETAIALDPEYVRAYVNLGSTYYEQGNYPLTIQNYETAIALDPEYSYTLYNIILLHEKIGNKKEVRYNAERLKEVDPHLYVKYQSRTQMSTLCILSSLCLIPLLVLL